MRGLAATPRAGWTYAMTTKPYDGWVKLGRSLTDPRARLKSCQTGNARELVIRVAWPVDVEQFLHAEFADFRGQGEWFALPFDLVEDMRRWQKRPRPWEDIVHRWTPTQVWEAAGLERRHHGLETLARAFMTRAAERQRGEAGRYATSETCQRWNLSADERRILARGGSIEIVYVGEIRDCRAVSPVAAIGSISGERGA